MSKRAKKRVLKEIIFSCEGKAQYIFETGPDEVIEIDIKLNKAFKAPVDQIVSMMGCIILEQTKEIQSLNERVGKLEATKNTKVY